MFNFDKNILYKDANLLIFNKPAGIAVHKGMGKGENLTPVFEQLTFGLPNPPQLTHRLDAATSGCLVLGRHKNAIRHMGKLFQMGAIQKTYWAIVEGPCASEEGLIDLPLAKQSAQKHRWWMKVDPNGQTAQTRYQVLERLSDTMTLLALSPITGRTHQLRVHCQAMGFPIYGDPIYGTEASKETRPYLHLHARAIEIPYHLKKPSIAATAPLPPHMMDTLKQFSITPL